MWWLFSSIADPDFYIPDEPLHKLTSEGLLGPHYEDYNDDDDGLRVYDTDYNEEDIFEWLVDNGYWDTEDDCWTGKAFDDDFSRERFYERLHETPPRDYREIRAGMRGGLKKKDKVKQVPGLDIKASEDLDWLLKNS